MTTITLHGILSKHFGSEFKMNIKKANQVFDAIDCNRPGFIKKLNDLSRKGFNYTLMVNKRVLKNNREINKEINKKEITSIDIVPIICGHGGVGGIIIGIGKALAWLAGGTAWANVSLMIITTALSVLLSPKPEFPDIPGAQMSTRGLEQSFAFANKGNVASQGTPVPVGYGRLMVGSQVIQATLKSFPQNVHPSEAIQQNPYKTSGGVSESSSIKLK